MQLQNREILKTLYSSYYLENHSLNDQEMSSHWKHYSNLFSVKIDETDKVVALRGIGFGDQMTRNPLQKGVHWIGHSIHFLQSQDKARIISLLAKTMKICNSTGFSVSFDVFKQILSLNLILHYGSELLMDKKMPVFIVIGDGFGFMACLLKSVFPNALIILVDIGKTLLFQAFYCQRAHPESLHVLLNSDNFNPERADFLYCPAHQLKELDAHLQSQSLKVDVSINIVSMQEMKPETVCEYFSFLRKNLEIQNLFYCCNREKKVLMGGEILEIKKYPYTERDHHYVDEYCPWYKFFLTARPYVYKKKPQFLGFKLPFINYFEGPIIHRLSKLAVDL